MTRRQRRNFDDQLAKYGREGHRLAKVAAESLGLSAEQLAAAEGDVNGEHWDMIHVRVLEILRHVTGVMTIDGAAALEEIEQRRGVAFLQRVAVSGKSAKAVAFALSSAHWEPFIGSEG